MPGERVYGSGPPSTVDTLQTPEAPETVAGPEPYTYYAFPHNTYLW